MKIIVALLLALAVTACASTQPNVQSPAQRLFAISADYLGIQEAIKGYVRLPRCTGTSFLSSKPCSTPEVVDVLRKGNTAASAALDAAEATIQVPNITDNMANLAIVSAQNAVAAVRTILVEYKVIKP